MEFGVKKHEKETLKHPPTECILRQQAVQADNLTLVDFTGNGCQTPDLHCPSEMYCLCLGSFQTEVVIAYKMYLFILTTLLQNVQSLRLLLEQYMGLCAIAIIHGLSARFAFAL